MRLSKSFWQTFKEIPKDAEITSHQLMIRAGLIHKSGPGLYNYLPMGLKVIRKVEKIVREEMEKISCEELTMTVVTPGELWQETKRWETMGDVMLRLVDKNKRDLCISPTNEEAVVDIFRKFVSSYKNLPVSLYQINTKFRDEIRPRFGLMRAREFIMKDAYSFHTNKECLDKTYQNFYQAYSNIFTRLGLDFIPVEADGGAITGGGKAKTHEFQVLANNGEDSIIFCPKCRYAANVETAETKFSESGAQSSDKVCSEVETPNKKTIEEVCAYLNMPTDQSLKSLLFTGIKNGKTSFIMVVVRGSDEVNEIKLKNALGFEQLFATTDGDIKNLNLIKGYIGPSNSTKENSSLYNIVWDSSVDLSQGYVVGANKENFHLTNFVPNRDLSGDKQVHSIRKSKAGDQCSICSGLVIEKRGIEVGHIFQLGDKYTKSMNSSILDQNGKSMFPIMGCYGIGVSRIVAAAIEQHHDEFGIKWPFSIAPFHIYLSYIAKDPEVKSVCDHLYETLKKQGYEVLYDDRNNGVGYMYKEADLLGLPIRIVVGERDYKNGGLVELKLRNSNTDAEKIPLNSIYERLKEIFQVLSK